MTREAQHTLGIEGSVALVTGATRGLGRAIARKLCTNGCSVILNYAHSDDDASALAIELSELKGSTSPLRADLRSPTEVARLFEAVRERYGRLDLFIHNAATFRPMSALRPDFGALDDEYALSVGPLLHGAEALADLMGRGGRVIVVSSNGAQRTIPGYVSVGVAKAALECLVRYMAVEFAPHGITVNAVATGMLDKGPEPSRAELMGRLAARSPSGRLTTPEDVADVVALMCTAEAGWIQGQTLMVDGGLSLLA